MATASGFYKNEVVGKLRPPVQIIQWNINRPDPSGYRTPESGVYKAVAKTGWVGGFTAQHESGVALDLGSIYADAAATASFYTDTACITANMGEVNHNPSSFFNLASGIDTIYKIFNMRIWLANYDAVSGYNPSFYYITHRTWHQGLHLTSGTAGILSMPLSLPSGQSIYRNATGVFLSGCFRDSQFSDYIYIVGRFPSGVYALGTYGGLGEGTLRFRFSYDWTKAVANVLSTDI